MHLKSSRFLERGLRLITHFKIYLPIVIFFKDQNVKLSL